MLTSIELQSQYQNLFEPLFIVDTKIQEIVFCNDICKKLKLVDEYMGISLLYEIIHCQDDIQIIKDGLAKQQEVYTEKCILELYGKRRMHVNVRVGNVADNESLLYIIVGYNFDELQNILVENRCFHTIYDKSYSYPFRLDIPTKTAYFIGSTYDDFNVNNVEVNYPQGIIDAGIIHPDDLDEYKLLIDRMYAGKTGIHAFRSRHTDGTWLWYEAQYVVNYDRDGNPNEIIGECINIQERVDLQTKLQYDELTKCLNKIAFTNVVAELLQKTKDEHALFIIDLDNFKAINDNLGHLFGDSVLINMGEKLRELFREADFVGRIGGDEFMVLMKSVYNKEIIESRAKKAVEQFNTTYQGETRAYKTSVSIGIATFPENGGTFRELYEHADIALYNTKSKGKNGYTFYSPIMTEGNMTNTTPFDMANRALSQHFDQQTIAEIFSLLTDSIDFKASLNKVLEVLALRFQASRCYIFEYDEEHELFSNTYEWCASNIQPEIDNLQNLPKDIYDPILEKVNSEGVFYCNDLSLFEDEPTYKVMMDQGIKSCLLTFNQSNGVTRSMLGFDDCINDRIWSSREVSTLMHAAKIVEQFLKQIHLIDALDSSLQDRLNVLDEIYSLAYIIDHTNHELLYGNHFFKEAYPNAKLGDKCYHVIHGTDSPCKNCPALKMREQGKNHHRSILPMTKLNKRMLVNTSNVGLFAGKESTFFSCSDINDLDD